MWKIFEPIFGKNEVVKSFAYNLQAKTTNPFFGTLIVVWVVRNWELVYTFFTFDEGVGLDKRVQILKAVATEVFTWNLFKASYSSFSWNLFSCVLIAIGIMLLSFLLLALSKYLTGVYQERVLPNIYSWIGEYDIEQSEKYMGLEDSYNTVKADLKKERDVIEGLDSEIKKLKKDVETRKKEVEEWKESTSFMDELLRFERLNEIELGYKILADIKNNKDFTNTTDAQDRILSRLTKSKMIKFSPNINSGSSRRRFVLTDLGERFFPKFEFYSTKLSKDGLGILMTSYPFEKN